MNSLNERKTAPLKCINLSTGSICMCMTLHTSQPTIDLVSRLLLHIMYIGARFKESVVFTHIHIIQGLMQSVVACSRRVSTVFG